MNCENIGSVSNVQTGPFGSQLHKEDYVINGTPIITVEHLGNRRMTTQNLPFVSAKDKERLSKYCLREGDLVFSRVGSVDRCSYVSADENDWMFSGRCLRVRCDCNKVLPLYLYYYFCLENTKQLVRNVAVGATMPSINTKLLSDIPFSCPTLPEQKAIAAVLSALDDKIELNNKINKTLEEMAQAIFKSWFVDFEPFQDGEFVESELGLIPKGWRIGSVGEVAQDIICGKTPPTNVKKNFGGNIPFITIPDMHNSVYITETKRFLTELGVSTQKNKMLPPNSICVSCIATAGLVSITSEISQTNQQINSVICDNKTSVFYMYFTLRNLSEHINLLGSSGSATKNLNKEQFSKIKILVPSTKKQESFNQLVFPLLVIIKENQLQTQTLATLRDTLLPKLMSGEIRVPMEVE